MRRRARRAHLQRLAGSGRLMREHGIPQFTVDGHRPVAAFDVLGVSFATELCYTNLLSALDLAGIPLSAADRDERHPLVLAGGHAAFNPEPVAEFVDGAVLGDGEQAVLAISALIKDWKRAGQPGGRDGLLLRLATEAGVYVPRFYDVDYLPDGRIRRVAPEPQRGPVHRGQAHRDGPGRVAVPAQAAGPGGRVRARAVQRGDLPRLHPGLPVLPGRDDHPAGARAQRHHGRRHGRVRAGRERLQRGRACSPCPAPTTARSTRSSPGWPTATRAARPGSPCRPPGSTRST